MRNYHKYLWLPLVMLFQLFISPLAAEEDVSTITLPAGTPIRLVICEQLYSQRNHAGDEIIFTVAEDIVMMGRTYLVAGTPVIGRVTHTRPSRSWGRSGNIDIEINSIHPLYSMPIPLSGEAGGSGANQTATSIGTTILLGLSVVGLLAGGSVSGSGAVIEAGMEFTVFTSEDGVIMDIPADEMQQMTDEWYHEKLISGFLGYSWDNKCTLASAMQSLGYTVDDSMIQVEPIGDYFYRFTVPLSDTQTAIFTIRPLEEAHAGKFITLDPENDLAVQIFRAVR